VDVEIILNVERTAVRRSLHGMVSR
jgi:hypothetical protein